MTRSMEDILAQLGAAGGGPMGPEAPMGPGPGGPDMMPPMGPEMGPGPGPGPEGPVGQVDEMGNITCPHCTNVFTL